MGREHCISGFIEVNSNDYQKVKQRIDGYISIKRQGLDQGESDIYTGLMFQQPYLNARNAIFYSINTFWGTTEHEVQKMIFDIVGLCKNAEATGLFCFDDEGSDAVIMWRIVMDKIYSFSKEHDKDTKQFKCGLSEKYNHVLLVEKEEFYPD